MRTSKIALAIATAAMLVSCGGGSSPTPTPIGTGGGGGGGGGTGCTIGQRLDFIDDVMEDWYLFPNLVASNVSRAGITDPQDYIDDLVAPARAQNIDRFFSFITSIQEEEAFNNSGATAGFGFRLAYDSGNRRAFVIETFEGTPALGANIDRGSEILAIGTSSANLQTVNSLFATGGAAAVSNALGPSTPGTSRVLRVLDQDGVTREVTLAKADFSLDPVSDRYGALIINDGGKQVGYINLRTFSVESANDDLRTAFRSFRAAGITELIIDFRYNGGGRISVADVMGDLMGAGLTGQIYSQIEFRQERANNNSVHRFAPTADSIAPTKIAFIGTRSTASASELVINSMQPYVDIALIGENTFGKPVGQSGFDLAACDDRFRPVTIQITNRDGLGEYFTGLASTVPNSCRANDDIFTQLGDPSETMIATALDYLAGRSCTAIAGGGVGVQSVDDAGPLAPNLRDMTYAQYEVPGLL